jgi:hypothetical protein
LENTASGVFAGLLDRWPNRKKVYATKPRITIPPRLAPIPIPAFAPELKPADDAGTEGRVEVVEDVVLVVLVALVVPVVVIFSVPFLGWLIVVDAASVVGFAVVSGIVLAVTAVGIVASFSRIAVFVDVATTELASVMPH